MHLVPRRQQRGCRSRLTRAGLFRGRALHRRYRGISRHFRRINQHCGGISHARRGIHARLQVVTVLIAGASVVIAEASVVAAGSSLDVDRGLQWSLQPHHSVIAGTCNDDCKFLAGQVIGRPTEIDFLQRGIAGTCSEHCRGMRWSLQGHTPSIAEASMPRARASMCAGGSSVLRAGSYTGRCRCISDARKGINRCGSLFQAPRSDMRWSLQRHPGPWDLSETLCLRRVSFRTRIPSHRIAEEVLPARVVSR